MQKASNSCKVLKHLHSADCMWGAVHAAADNIVHIQRMLLRCWPVKELGQFNEVECMTRSSAAADEGVDGRKSNECAGADNGV